MTTEPKPRSASAPAMLCLGEPGNGKTYALATLAKHELVEKMFYLYTDPGGDESLIDSLMAHDVPIDKVHFKYIAPAAQDFSAMEQLARKVNSLDYESIAKIKAGINKQDHRQMFGIIESLQNFVCDRTGESFPSADTWPETYAFVFDSLTGLNRIAREGAVGAKPTLHQGEWGVAMAMEENFIRLVISSIKGPRVMIGHLDMNKDEYTGRMLLQVALLGNKLAPQIPHLFSDVFYARREGADFMWSTADTRMALKNRNLPLGDKIAPDYGIILDKWRSRREYLERSKATPETEATETTA